MLTLLLALGCPPSEPTPPVQPPQAAVQDPPQAPEQPPSAEQPAPDLGWSLPPLEPDVRTWDLSMEPPPELSDPSLSAIDLNNKGYAGYKKGKLGYAIQLWQAALQKKPDYTTALYNLACGLALARAQGQVCSFDAYPDTILGMLERVVADDPVRLAKVKSDPDLASVRHTTRFAVLTGADLQDPQDLRTLLVGMSFHSPGVGAYGSMEHITFLADGELERSNLDISSGAPTTHTGSGTWSLEGTRVRIDGVDHVLHPSGWLAPPGAAPHEGWYDHPSECEA